MCWEISPQMALMISCDLINRDLVVKLYFFILYLNICNIFHWENFVYGKDFYIERIYCQIELYIYCLVFIAFLCIYTSWLFSFAWNIWNSLRQNLSVSNKHGIYMEHITLGKLKQNKKHLDGLSPTYLKPPPPPKNGLCFFSPLFYRSFPILT